MVYSVQTNQSFDNEYCKNNKKEQLPKRSLMDILDKNNEFSMFSKIIRKSGLDNKLNDLSYIYTLFVTPNNKLLTNNITNKIIDNMDIGTCKKIGLFSMLNNTIDQELLQYSPSGIFPTLDRNNNLKVYTKSKRTRIKENVNIIHYNYLATNGIIHVIDNLLIP